MVYGLIDRLRISEYIDEGEAALCAIDYPLDLSDILFIHLLIIISIRKLCCLRRSLQYILHICNVLFVNGVIQIGIAKDIQPHIKGTRRGHGKE